ncbi:thioredoxin family protein [Macrococcoides caseolyticum]|uniref:thioredoxin family protein n=1 Tax=Macrococcoides caseolyticum TaxID=69966 RepID=UPI001F1DBE5C|nr:thioredoxin family protein [Macrococcus caseolyticus]MCE4955809.1 thioredoxin family protein [Macrococcus caseolyticus]
MNLSKHLHFELSEGPMILFGYTPFCGTCKLAEKMLDITVATLSVPVKKIDLNYYANLSQALGIQSVPVLIFVMNGEVKSLSYKFESVTTLYENINLLLTNA